MEGGALLRVYLEASIFFEVGVKSKSSRDRQSFHEGEGGAVCETKIVIAIGFKQPPGFFYNFRGNINDSKKLAVPDCLPKLNGNRVSGPKPNDRIALIQNIIAGNQGLALLQPGIPKGKRLGMMSIQAILHGQEC